MVAPLSFFAFAFDGSCAAYVTSQRLWKWLPKLQTGTGDYFLGMPETPTPPFHTL
jgi:hypothetical protein